MTSLDPELLRVLATADAARPVSPGGDFTPARLAHAADRRTKRRLLVTGLVLSLAAALCAGWPRHGDDRDEARITTALAVEIERLQRRLSEWRTGDADRVASRERDRRLLTATIDLRCELALARSAPLSPLVPPRSPR